ncbi:V-set domain-containing T-cell activation inhibitor 1-like [Carassius auratus]|uniref:V-set domain-containing T-cell activation inhibitor 1-like n=1 Tax=Carassius auratus TaxID=7957 RepID=A0A6P6J3W1_CARAU|nr:V-set domain-containing T-cell activation inhibitor 1-like [Carassius auratus]
MCRRCCIISVFILLTGSVSLHQVVEVTEGDSVILNCSQNSIVLEDKPLTVHWRHDDVRNVFDIINGNISVKEQDEAYKNRAEVLHEELKKGNIFLKLTDLQLSDGGTYLCFVPDLGLERSTQLVVKERCMTCTTAEITSHGAGARLGKTLYLLIIIWFHCGIIILS